MRKPGEFTGSPRYRRMDDRARAFRILTELRSLELRDRRCISELLWEERALDILTEEIAKLRVDLVPTPVELPPATLEVWEPCVECPPGGLCDFCRENPPST